MVGVVRAWRDRTARVTSAPATPFVLVMSGLPGTGKSTIAHACGRALGVPVLAVDRAEAAMWRAGIDREQPTGVAAYAVVEAFADGVLAGGLPVVVDAVNAVEPARAQWRDLARRHGVPMHVVEVVCSDPALHRTRLESRDRSDLPGITEPSWADVVAREHTPWTDERLVIDTVEPLADCVRAVLASVHD